MKRIAIVLALFAAPALAQPQTLEQRIGAQIGACTIQNIALVAQIELLQARVKELETAAKTADPAPKPN